MAVRAGFLCEVSPALKRSFMKRMERFNITTSDVFRSLIYNFLYMSNEEVRAFLVQGEDRKMQESLKRPARETAGAASATG